MDDVPFSDLPAEKYPFVIRFMRDGVEVHRIDVPGPGVVKVPGLGSETAPASVRVEYADGTVDTA